MDPVIEVVGDKIKIITSVQNEDVFSEEDVDRQINYLETEIALDQEKLKSLKTKKDLFQREDIKQTIQQNK